MYREADLFGKVRHVPGRSEPDRRNDTHTSYHVLFLLYTMPPLGRFLVLQPEIEMDPIRILSV